ncbi:MAG: hypothetical protein QOE08_1804, partial [Thermoleophilaceae bacterium]|nr:hypothetical protein [Thermoleophilaceae bacterium]
MPTQRKRVSTGATLAALVIVALVAIAIVGFTRERSDPTVAPAGLQQRFEHVVSTVSPQVVEIRGQRGLGSGVVFD